VVDTKVVDVSTGVVVSADNVVVVWPGVVEVAAGIAVVGNVVVVWLEVVDGLEVDVVGALVVIVAV